MSFSNNVPDKFLNTFEVKNGSINISKIVQIIFSDASESRVKRLCLFGLVNFASNFERERPIFIFRMKKKKKAYNLFLLVHKG
jgi:hypothetical protein